MANYFIIGGDGKEYGPVTEADVQLWISEGRLNAQSRAKAEGDAEYRALGLFPEFAAVLGAQIHGAPVTASAPEDFRDRDYELDISGCVTRGWEVFKENFGTLFGGFLLLILLQMACAGALGMVSAIMGNNIVNWPVPMRMIFDQIGRSVLSLVVGPMMGGLLLVYLKAVRREATGIGEVFSGFQQSYVQLFLGSLVVSLITSVCMMPFQYVFLTKASPVLQQIQHMQNNPEAMQHVLPQLMAAFSSTLPVLLICMVPVTFFTVSLQFTLPLIIDKQMTFGTAMSTSFRMVLKHWWIVFGLSIVIGLICVAGVLGCCIGVIFTAPIGLVVTMCAYETIFGAQKN